MSTVTMHRCDQCGKLAEGDEPKGWQVFELPFNSRDVEACSPGCAKRLLGDDVDQAWGVEPATSVVMSQESVDAIVSATRSAA